MLNTPEVSFLDPFLKILPISIALAAYVATIRIRLKERARDCKDTIEKLEAREKAEQDITNAASGAGIKRDPAEALAREKLKKKCCSKANNYSNRADELIPVDAYLIISSISLAIPVFIEIVLNPYGLTLVAKLRHFLAILGTGTLLLGITILVILHLKEWNIKFKKQGNQ